MITFVHTADWQIGRPFSAFPADVAGVLADARLTAIDRIAEAARAAGARHVLVAGDVFDASDITGRLLRQPVDKLAHHDDQQWHLLPGNHDPVQPGGLWERLARVGPPGNVRLHTTPAPIEIEPGVWLLPAPVTTSRRSGDPTLWMDSAVTPPHAVRIGLAHGSVRDFGEKGDGIIAPVRARSAHLDYLALGDWHGAVSIEPRTWYSGTPEIDRFVDNLSGGALVVRIDGAGVLPTINAVSTSRFIWTRRDFQIEAATDLRRVEREVLSWASEPDRLIVRLALTGSLRVEDAALLEDWRAVMHARLRHFELDATGVRISLSQFDSSQFGMGTELQAAADWLTAIAADADDPRRPFAEAAIVRLLALSANGEESAAA